MLIRFGFEAVSTAAIKKIELVEAEGAAENSYQVTYLNEEVETFHSAYDLDEQFATPVAAPAGFYVVDADDPGREPVLAFLIDPVTSKASAPVPVTVRGACHIDGSRGLLAPDGSVSTLAQTFESYSAFALDHSSIKADGLDGSTYVPHAPRSIDGSPFTPHRKL